METSTDGGVNVIGGDELVLSLRDRLYRSLEDKSLNNKEVAEIFDGKSETR